MKPKSFFSMPFPQNKSRIMFVMGNATLIPKLLKTSKNSFKATMTQIRTKKLTNPTIVATTEASLLLAIASHSPIAITQTPLQLRLLQTLVTPMTSLGTALAPLCVMTPVCLMFATNAVFAKIAMMNGLTAQCITLPLDHKLQRILMPCANPPKLPSLNPPIAVSPHHHVVSVNTTRCTTLPPCVAPNVVNRVVALAAALHVVHPAVINHTMIAPVVNPLVPTMTLTLGITIFLMIRQLPYTIANQKISSL